MKNLTKYLGIFLTILLLIVAVAGLYFLRANDIGDILIFEVPIITVVLITIILLKRKKGLLNIPPAPSPPQHPNTIYDLEKMVVGYAFFAVFGLLSVIAYCYGMPSKKSAPMIFIAGILLFIVGPIIYALFLRLIEMILVKLNIIKLPKS